MVAPGLKFVTIKNPSLEAIFCWPDWKYVPLSIHIRENTNLQLNRPFTCENIEDVVGESHHPATHRSISPAVSHLPAACSPLLLSPAVGTDGPPLLSVVDLKQEAGALQSHWAWAGNTSNEPTFWSKWNKHQRSLCCLNLNQRCKMITYYILLPFVTRFLKDLVDKVMNTYRYNPILLRNFTCGSQVYFDAILLLLKWKFKCMIFIYSIALLSLYIFHLKPVDAILLLLTWVTQI